MKAFQKIYKHLFNVFLALITLSAQAQIGTPINPTYGNVQSTASLDYYNQLMGLSGTELLNKLKTVVVNSSTKGQTYGDVWLMLREADENPANTNQVWQIYIEQGINKSEQNTGGSTGWNREHIFPQSRGGFEDGTSTSSDGKEIYFSTSSSQILHAHADAHHLRAAFVLENSNRGNLDFSNVSGPRTKNSYFYEPPLSAKGDVARALFYMAVRYDALSLGNGDQDGQIIGDLVALLSWHKLDPPDDFEMRRNNVVYDWQNNRNPFIDIPDLVDYIWGDKQGLPWPGDQYIHVSSVVPFPQTAFGNSSEPQTYQVSGEGLGSLLTIDAPTHFEISLNNQPAGFVKHLEIATTNGKLDPTDVYVRFTPESTTGGLLEGNIEHTSNAITAQLSVSGTEGTLPVEIYVQDFETNCAPDWIKYSVSSNKNWICENYGHLGGTAVAINNYQADASSEDWLISPAFDLQGYNNPELSFWIESTYSGSSLQLMYSTNYSGSGNPNMANWSLLSNIVLPEDWTEKSLDISVLGAGPFYLAFKHTSGNTPGNCSRINLDDISLVAYESGAFITTSVTDIGFEYTSPGQNSPSLTYTINGINLSGDITVSASLPFELSLNGTSWTNSLNIPSNEASDKTVFVRYSPTEFYLGNNTGSIIHSTNGAIDVTVKLLVETNPLLPIDAGSLGKDQTLDIVSWNLEWFGAPQKSGHASTYQQQLSSVSSTILSLDADIYALQEVVADALNGNYLDSLVIELNRLTNPGTYAGLLGPRYSFDNYQPSYDYPAQRVCYIYRTEIFSNIFSKSMFSEIYPSPNVTYIAGYTGNPYEFWSSGRLPFLMEATVNIDGLSVPISFVNIHAKCCSDSKERRLADALFLKDELDKNFDIKNMIVLGDYNDYLTGSISGGESPYISWYSGSNEDYLPGAGRNVDHISISNELYYEHQSLTNNTFTPYTSISDHRPVLLRLKLDANGYDGQTVTLDQIANKPVNSEPFEINALSSKGLPVEYELISGPAVLSGKILTVTGFGTVVVKAYNYGDQNTLPASDQKQFDVVKANQQINFELPVTVNLSQGAVNLSASASSGLPVTFSITSGNGNITGNTLYFSQAGTITVQAYQAGNEIYNAASISKTITVQNTTFVPVMDNLTFWVYPNPSDGMIKIKHNFNLDNPEVKIFSISGKYIEMHRLTGNEINLSHLKPGIYIIRLEADGEAVSKLLMIESFN